MNMLYLCIIHFQSWPNITEHLFVFLSALPICLTHYIWYYLIFCGVSKSTGRSILDGWTKLHGCSAGLVSFYVYVCIGWQQAPSCPGCWRQLLQVPGSCDSVGTPPPTESSLTPLSIRDLEYVTLPVALVITIRYIRLVLSLELLQSRTLASYCFIIHKSSQVTIFLAPPS